MMSQLTARMKEFEERMMQRLSEMAADIQTVKMRMTQLEDRVAKTERECAHVDELRKEVQLLRSSIGEYENSSVANDIIINGIPQMHDEHLSDVFNDICKAVQVNTPPFVLSFVYAKIIAKVRPL